MTRAIRLRPLPLAALGLLLAACAPMAPEVSARHYPTTRFVDGTRVHVFVFAPAAPRALDDRIRLARAALRGDRRCRWTDAAPAVIAAETARQGDRYAGEVLAVPLDCTA